MLIVKHVVKKFHDKTILDDVSFTVQPGEIVVLLGQSGVGKSTMLRALANLETIDQGSLELDNAELDFKKVGMVFQDFNLFAHLSVLENLTLPLVKVAQKSEVEAQEIAQKLLAQFNVAAFAAKYPAQLSGGQKQRVALARAVCMNPEVLCLDEPTSALDPQLTSQVADMVSELARDKKLRIVIATHDTGFLKNIACTVHLMQQGKIIESATTQDLEKDEQSFAQIKKFIQGK